MVRIVTPPGSESLVTYEKHSMAIRGFLVPLKPRMPAAAGDRALHEAAWLPWEDQAAALISHACSLLFTQQPRDTRTTFSLLLSPCLKPGRISSLDQSSTTTAVV